MLIWHTRVHGTGTRILFYKHRCKRRPSHEFSRLDGRCLKSVLRFDKNFFINCTNTEKRTYFLYFLSSFCHFLVIFSISHILFQISQGFCFNFTYFLILEVLNFGNYTQSGANFFPKSAQFPNRCLQTGAYKRYWVQRAFYPFFP